MGIPDAFRAVIVGSATDIRQIGTAIMAAPDRFAIENTEIAGEDVPSLDAIAGLTPDIAVIGASVRRPLPLARELRAACPRSQVIFLLPPERLERFRASLPFVPQLGSAWTASTDADHAKLGQLFGDAARVARERAATATVLARINQQLSDAANAAPTQVRRLQLAQSERYLATVLTQSPDAFVAVDREGNVIAYNDAAVRMFGIDPEAPSPVKASELVAVGDRSRLDELVQAALGGGVHAGFETLVGGDRARCDIEMAFAPVHDAAGDIASVSVTARDITERKRAEAHQKLLINELNHRVKNTLAVVQGLAQQTFKREVPIEKARSAFEARLAALATAHNILTRQNWESASLDELIRSSLTVASGVAPARLHIDGPDLLLAPQTAVSVAMAIHELCTNAIKYGALSNDTGRVDVRWQVDDEAGGRRLRLSWTERGGPIVSKPSRRGFGTRMIERGLATELRAQIRLDFNPAGLVCLIEAPAPETAS